MKTVRLAGLLALALAIGHNPALAQKRYGPGASDSEIKIGQTMAYSGPASAYATIGKVQAAYFRMLNEAGGVNGRKLNLISVDDGYSAPKTLAMTRRLVESDQVAVLLSSLGTSQNLTVRRYLNDNQVPQLFVSSAAGLWNDPKNFPWTVAWQPTYPTEGRIFAQSILKETPNAKVAILYQNDDFGKDALNGFKEALGDHKRMIVSEVAYQISDPTIDSQMVALKASQADVFINIATPKAAAQAIRKARELGWNPKQYLFGVASSIGGTLKPAGLENAVGIISTAYLKDPTEPRWKDDRDVAAYVAFMRKYYPDGDVNDWINVLGYSMAETMVIVLKQCGNDLTRENIRRQAANLKDVTLSMLLPGIRLNTSADDYAPVESVQLVTFDGKAWKPQGEIIGR